MVIKPVLLMSDKYGVQFTVTSTCKPSEKYNEIYKKNKENFKKNNHENINIKEFKKRLEKNQSLLAFVKDAIPIIRYTVKEAKKHDIIHARSYGGGLIAFISSIFSGKPFIFDMRGTLPEETVEVGKINKKSIKYKLLKFVEKLLIKKSICVIAVSENMKNYVKKNYGKKEVINLQNPTDFKMFNKKANLKKKSRVNFIYSGSLQVWHLPEITIQYYKKIQEKFDNKVFFYFCVNDTENSKSLFEKYDIPSNSYKIQTVPYEEMPNYYEKSDIGFCFIRESFSKSVCFPVKFSEYIASEIFVLTNENIGDLPKIVRDYNVGLCFDNLYNIDNNVEIISKIVSSMLNNEYKPYDREELSFLDWNKVRVDNLYNLYLKYTKGKF